MPQKSLIQNRPGLRRTMLAAAGRSPRLHRPRADVRDRLAGTDQSGRVTPVALAFVVECVTAGRTDDQINRLLRDAGFLLDGEPDLSPATLSGLRARPECRLDLDLLTDEARQAGHNHVSQIIVGWSMIFDAAYDRLMGRGEFGDNFGRVSQAEIVGTLTAATKVILGTFAPGLPGRLNADMCEAQRAEALYEASLPPERNAYSPNLMSPLERSLRRQFAKEDKQRSAKEAGSEPEGS